MVVAERMSFRKHALVQDSGDQYAFLLPAVEHDMPAVLRASQSGKKVVARSTQGGIVGEHLAAGFEFVQVAQGLVFAPGEKRVSADAPQVSLRRSGESKDHGLCARRGQPKRCPDPFENVTFGNATGVAFIDGAAKRGKFRLVFFVFANEVGQRGMNHLAGILKATTIDILPDEAFEFVGELHRVVRHEDS